MAKVDLYEVGGCVRDEILGIPSKDIDFACVVIPDEWDHYAVWDADAALAALLGNLSWRGFDIFLTQPEFFTIRGRFPREHTVYPGVAADFVLCRKEGPYSDGRRPDYVMPGSLADDLARRDFTVNAIAKGLDGKYIDLHDGIEDLDDRILRCVGSTKDRFTEDALRAVRAIRFRVTKGLAWHGDVSEALNSEWLPPLVAAISIDRRRDELHRAMHHDTLKTLRLLMHYVSPDLTEAIFEGGLWLRPTNEK